MTRPEKREEALRILEAVKSMRANYHEPKSMALVEEMVPTQHHTWVSPEMSASLIPLPGPEVIPISPEPTPAAVFNVSHEATAVDASQNSALQELVDGFKQSLQLMQERNNMLERAVDNLLEQQQHIQYQLREWQAQTHQEINQHFRGVMEQLQQMQVAMLSREEVQTQLLTLVQQNEQLHQLVAASPRLKKHAPRPLAPPAPALAPAPTDETAAASEAPEMLHAEVPTQLVSESEPGTEGDTISYKLAKLEEKLRLKDDKISLLEGYLHKKESAPKGVLQRLKMLVERSH